MDFDKKNLLELIYCQAEPQARYRLVCLLAISIKARMGKGKKGDKWCSNQVLCLFLIASVYETGT